MSKVQKPDHYNWIGIECMDVVKYFDFLEGNIIKYVWRWRRKNGIEDLEKARVYLDTLIERERSASAVQRREPADIDRDNYKCRTCGEFISATHFDGGVEYHCGCPGSVVSRQKEEGAGS